MEARNRGKKENSGKGAERQAVSNSSVAREKLVKRYRWEALEEQAGVATEGGIISRLKSQKDGCRVFGRSGKKTMHFVQASDSMALTESLMTSALYEFNMPNNGGGVGIIIHSIIISNLARHITKRAFAVRVEEKDILLFDNEAERCGRRTFRAAC